MKPILSFLLFNLFSISLIAQSDVLFDEIRLTETIAEFGLTGKGAIVAIFDRGIDYRHSDFINEDGTTRILAIYDLSDNSGAQAANNPYGKGTIYDEAQINAALTSGNKLATRDASGHGTVTAGVAAGNGRASDGSIIGVAPEAKIVVVKITSEGAPAHDDQPAETGFYASESLIDGINFVKNIGTEKGLPVAMIANFGSSGGPMDGTSALSLSLDDEFTENDPGVAFICGSSDDGGLDNHAQLDVSSNSTYDLIIKKNEAPVRVDLWYDSQDQISFSIKTPTSSVELASVTNTSDAFNANSEGITAYHRGSDVDFYNAQNNKNELLVDFNGAAADITISIETSAITNGRIDASLNPSYIFINAPSIFKTYVKEGYTVWDLAAAKNNICPNSYIISNEWKATNGGTYSYPGHENGIGSLWTGSGIGPTYDGRIGIDISVPGNINFGAYGPDSYFGSLDFNIVQDGEHPYGVIAAVSGANPVMAGVVALMLEADPTLSAPEIKRILQKTARADSFTGEVPNVSWGYGKLDVYAAINEIYNPTSVSISEIDNSIKLQPNPVINELNLILPGNYSGETDIQIYNTTGELVLVQTEQQNQSSFSINVNPLPPGIYFLKARQQDNYFSSKFIKI
ncbi:S8/S53 family peptidase [Portibacter lacus]|uniref:Peptidase S8 n=1 Tax=Portibacter lacus TaxID=1099794 RepID=A0AA37WG55_9BACT|nr:S8/S53 family peptidase [Portibacter lacus]GLR17700.1 peptidase S8 [Portibacter lacus]